MSAESLRFPRGRITLRSMDAPGAPRYYAYVPERLVETGTLIVAVHGISRDARLQALAWKSLADSLGCPLLAPLFEQDLAPAFQRLDYDRFGRRSGDLLDAMIEDLQSSLGWQCPHLVLAGYSAGAQFCHRYALTQAGRVRALILGAAGWYTWPDPALHWPRGTGMKQGGADVLSTDLGEFLRLRTFVYVGSRDTARGKSLRATPGLDARQGRDRVERAHRWVDALQTAAAEHGLPSRVCITELPGVAHDFSAAVGAGVIDMATQWLRARHLAPQPPTSTTAFPRFSHAFA